MSRLSILKNWYHTRIEAPVQYTAINYAHTCHIEMSGGISSHIDPIVSALNWTLPWVYADFLSSHEYYEYRGRQSHSFDKFPDLQILHL